MVKKADNLLNIILEAKHTDESSQKRAKETILEVLDEIGARRFLEEAGDILEDNFKIEEKRDLYAYLKGIFSISLDDLQEKLAGRKFDLSEEHPLSILLSDHASTIKQLKRLRLSLGRINLNKETTTEEINKKLEEVGDYYTGLEYHIRKEENVLFPVLEIRELNVHLETLREEHRELLKILSEIMGILSIRAKKSQELDFTQMLQLKENFISIIARHIFWESFIFYPAVLEYTLEEKEWDKIRKDFRRI